MRSMGCGRAGMLVLDPYIMLIDLAGRRAGQGAHLYSQGWFTSAAAVGVKAGAGKCVTSTKCGVVCGTCSGTSEQGAVLGPRSILRCGCHARRTTDEALDGHGPRKLDGKGGAGGDTKHVDGLVAQPLLGREL